MTTTEFIQFAHHQHDVVCNQKYDDVPYSFHLKVVEKHAHKFEHLLPALMKTDTAEELKSILHAVYCGCAGHDLIEDARLTYNNIVDKAGYEIAEIIYACTEERGKNRDERHSVNYYNTLTSNKLAIFVKLCDIMANVKYSILTNSTMLIKHKQEWRKNVEYFHPVVPELEPMFEHLDSLFKVG